ATGEYVAGEGRLTYARAGRGGPLLGYPFRTSTQISLTVAAGTSTDTTSVIFSSDWKECWVGESEALTIELSGETTYTPDGGTTWISAFQSRQTVYRAVMTHDIGLRRPAFFTVLTGVRP